MRETLNNFKKVLLGEDSNRIFGLDIIRAIAILLVLLSHSRHYLDFNLESFSEYLSIGGYLGVEIFFVLSGFLIGGILIKNIEREKKTFSFKHIKVFWIRRWFRTLPNYFLILLFNIIFLSLIKGYFVFDLKYLFFLQNFLAPIFDDLNYGQSWSLTIEEWFYILTPVLFLGFVRLSKIEVKKSILYAILAIIIVFPFFKYLYFILVDFFLNKGDQITFHFYRSVTVLRLDTLLYGVLIAYLNIYHQPFVKKHYKTMGILGLLFLFAIIALSEAMVIYDIDKPPLLFSILFPSLGSFGLSLLLPFFNEIRISPGNFVSKFITITSIISYSLYLIHFSIVVPIIKAINFIPPIFQLLLFWVLSYVISSLNYYFFEIRMTRMRESLSQKEITNQLH